MLVCGAGTRLKGKHCSRALQRAENYTIIYCMSHGRVVSVVLPDAFDTRVEMKAAVGIECFPAKSSTSGWLLRSASVPEWIDLGAAGER